MHLSKFLHPENEGRECICMSVCISVWVVGPSGLMGLGLIYSLDFFSPIPSPLMPIYLYSSCKWFGVVRSRTPKTGYSITWTILQGELITENLQLSLWFLKKRPKTVSPKEQWYNEGFKNPEAKGKCWEREKRTVQARHTLLVASKHELRAGVSCRARPSFRSQGTQPGESGLHRKNNRVEPGGQCGLTPLLAAWRF